MANVFKNSMTSGVGTTGVVAYTAPAATTTTIIGVSVANINSNNISVSVMARDSSENKTVYLVKDALITPNSSTILVGGEQKIVLEANDFLSNDLKLFSFQRFKLLFWHKAKLNCINLGINSCCIELGVILIN
jgi:hypothetical protein